MIFKRIELVPGRKNVWLDCYIADRTENFTRKAILVIPGGGYHNVCMREGEPVAQAFMPYGFNAFVLSYSICDEARFPQPLIEASLAVKHIKDNAEEYGLDPEEIFVTGFSAGGHLCTALGVLWHMEEIYKAVDMPYGCNKPKGIIPVYPVISSDFSITHIKSFENIVGVGKLEEEYAVYSLDKRVDERSAPAFIVHTSNDQVVNVRNSILLANAYAEHKIPFELHIFEDAPHGMSVSNKITSCGNPKFDNSRNAKWVELAAGWIESQR